MRTVITYGTFDVLHRGHIRLLDRAKKLGDKLVVYVSTDKFNAVKGKTCHDSFAKRFNAVKELDMVDVVLPEINWEQKREDLLSWENPILVMGSDWVDKFVEFEDIAVVVYLPRTPNISSTEIRKKNKGNLVP